MRLFWVARARSGEWRGRLSRLEKVPEVGVAAPVKAALLRLVHVPKDVGLRVYARSRFVRAGRRAGAISCGKTPLSRDCVLQTPRASIMLRPWTRARRRI